MRNFWSGVGFLILVFGIQAPLWAQVGTPVPAGSDLNGADAPALPDLSQLDLPVVPTPSQASQPVQLPPPPTAVPTPTSVPLAMPVNTATPVPSMPAPPAVSNVFAAPTVAPAEGQVSQGGLAPQGGLADYYPWTKGKSLSYQYLKSAGAKRTRLVECLEQETMPNGTVHYTLKTTEGAQAVQDKYSLYDNKVDHTFAGKMALAGHTILAMPSATAPAEWQLKGGDGLTHAYKASFGQAQVYQKVYPDCVIVTDKALSGGKALSTRLEYYAKGIGLVAVETYGPGMKLIPAESLALVEDGR
ncbi:MAG TPA: hypothetical protein VMU88_10685 [bacterium]|nr:hypothetical protein [bacterium]